MSDLADHFEYLDRLRKNGTVNMLGAAPFLADAYGLEIMKARSILRQWMNSYDPKKTPEARAAEEQVDRIGEQGRTA